MALVGANRTSELQALDLQFRYFTPDGVVLKLSCLTKKRKAGTPLKECFFASFPHDNRLCVVKHLRAYEQATKNFRDIKADIPAPLFLSYVKPHNLVTSQRIAHRIKDTLTKAGVDTNIFKAHSVRELPPQQPWERVYTLQMSLRRQTGEVNPHSVSSTIDHLTQQRRTLPSQYSVPSQRSYLGLARKLQILTVV